MTGKIIWMSWVGVPCIVSLAHLDSPHACLWRCTGEAVITSTQLTDMDEKRIGKSGPGVEHTHRPEKVGPMKFPKPNEQKAL